MRRRPLFLLCLVLTGVLSVLQALGVSLYPEPPGNAEARLYLQVPRSCLITGTVSGSEVRDSYALCILSDAVLSVGAKRLSISDVKITYKKLQRFPAGTVLSAYGPAEPVRGRENPGQFDTGLYYRLRNIGFLMRNPEMKVLKKHVNIPAEAASFCRGRLRSMISRVYPADVSAVMSAVLAGDKSNLDPDTRMIWQTGGVLHMLAISGMHLTMLGMGLYRFLRKIRMPLKTAGPLTGLMMVFYSAVTGMSVSTVRALVLFLLLILADMTGRTADAVTSLSLAAVLILLENPYYLQYAGFQLSFTAAFTMVFFRERSRGVRITEFHLILLPLTAWHYYEIPLYSTAVNALLVPLLPFVMGFGLAGTAAGSLFLAASDSVLPCASLFRSAAAAAAAPGTGLVRFFTYVLTLVQRLPFSSVICGRPVPGILVLYAGMLVLWSFLAARWRLYRRRLILWMLIPGMAALLALHPVRGLRVTVQAVGQGDSILLQTDDGINLLVDGGSSSIQEVGKNRILPCVKMAGIRRLDYIFLSHMDEDHINGVREILEMISGHACSLQVDAVVFPALSEKDETYLQMERLAEKAGARVLTAEKGDRITAGKLSIGFVGPDPACETVPPDANAQCLVMEVSYGEFDALFTGDVCGEGEAQLIRELEAGDRRFEMLKVAHHGSKYSTPAAFLRDIRPDISIISCGRDNRYGHPHDTLLSRLKACGTKVFRTDRQGAVITETEGSIFSVRTMLP